MSTKISICIVILSSHRELQLDFPAIDLQIYRVIMLSLLAVAGVESPPMTIKLLHFNRSTLFPDYIIHTLSSCPLFHHPIFTLTHVFTPLSLFFLGVSSHFLYLCILSTVFIHPSHLLLDPQPTWQPSLCQALYKIS